MGEDRQTAVLTCLPFPPSLLASSLLSFLSLIQLGTSLGSRMYLTGGGADSFLRVALAAVLELTLWHHGLASAGPTSGGLSEPLANLSWLSLPWTLSACVLSPYVEPIAMLFKPQHPVWKWSRHLWTLEEVDEAMDSPSTGWRPKEYWTWGGADSSWLTQGRASMCVR